jgi:hypothetical protein
VCLLQGSGRVVGGSFFRDSGLGLVILPTGRGDPESKRLIPRRGSRIVVFALGNGR